MTNAMLDLTTDEATDDRADRIVAAALAEFAERGYAAGRMSAIARRAGVSLPTLRRHFATKDEVFRAVVRSTLVSCLRALDEGTLGASDGSAADAVRAVARRYWRLTERPDVVAILRLAIGELPRFPELAVFSATETLERFARTLERIIDAGVRRGELRAVDVRAAARMVVATLAAHALWFAYPDIYAGVTGADRQHAAAATIETVVRALERCTPE